MTPELLRSRAEDRLHLTRTQIREMPQKDVEELVYELQVHQVELNMQNEELRRIQDELALSRQKYRDLYDFAPIGYLTLNREGQIIEANFYACMYLDVTRDRITGKKLNSFVDSASQDDFYTHFHRVFDTGGRQTADLRLVRDRVVQVNTQVHIPEDGNCCMTMTDVTHMAAPAPARAAG